jgi:hypothetical protein
MFITVELPARVTPVLFIVVIPVPVVSDPDPPIVVFPTIVRPPEPLFKLIAVVPVVFPTVIIFAFEFVPRFIEPLEPVSRFKFPVVPDVIFKSDAEAEVSESVDPPASVVAPEPVRVAELEAREKRFILAVLKSKPYASVVPIEESAPNPLPPFINAKALIVFAVVG